MLIRYLSDLHLEFVYPQYLNKFLKKIPLPKENEVCVLAGDIGNPYSTNYDIFMKWISKHFTKTFVIPGNHEYYNKPKTMSEINAYMADYFKQYDNISFLNNGYEIYQDYCFIGSILWSKITNPAYKINDVYKITDLDITKYNMLNAECISFLSDAIKENAGYKLIIITHHVPSNSLIDQKYKVGDMIEYNQWFCFPMDEFIERNKSQIKLWFYGHTHTPCDKIIHGVQFLGNPIGYPQENANIDFGKCVEI